MKKDSNTKQSLFVMTPEERHRRNGDKRTAMGHSSTGIPLPSDDDMKELHEIKEDRRERYDEKHKDEIKKKRGKWHVPVPMGGKSK